MKFLRLLTLACIATSCSPSFFNMGEPIPMKFQMPQGQQRVTYQSTLSWGENLQNPTVFTVEQSQRSKLKTRQGNLDVEGTLEKFDTDLKSPLQAQFDPRNLQLTKNLAGESYAFTANIFRLSTDDGIADVEGLGGVKAKLKKQGVADGNAENLLLEFKKGIKTPWKKAMSPYPIQPQKGMVLQRQTIEEVIFGSSFGFMERMEAVGKVPCGTGECLLINVEPNLQLTEEHGQALQSSLIFSRNLQASDRVRWKNISAKAKGRYLIDTQTSLTQLYEMDFTVTATAVIEGQGEKNFEWHSARKVTVSDFH